MTAAAFATIADLEAFLQITIPGADAAAEHAIEDASAAIQNYTNQRIELVTDDFVVVDGQGIGRLFLPELPVIAISSIVENGTTLVVDDYRWTARGILERAGVVWGIGLGLVVVTYSHGYAEIPIDIRAVCTRAASRAYQAGLRAAAVGAAAGTVESEQLADYNVRYVTQQPAPGESALGASAASLLLRSEKEILDRYRYRGLA